MVGAGAAGLAAAWRLASAGVSVTVYEARDLVGGRLRTVQLDDVRADAAVQLIGSYYAATLRLAAETGAEALLSRAPARDALWRGGRAHGVEYGSTSRMVVSAALPVSLKLRLGARYLGFLARHADILDPAEPIAGSSLDDESIAEWGGRELGRDFVELMAYPLLAAYYGSTPEETSAAFFHALARAGLSVRLYSVLGGMAELAKAIASAVETRGARVETGREVVGVADEGRRAVVRLRDGEAAYDAVIIAVPPGQVSRLLELSEEAAMWFSGVRQRRTVSLVLELAQRPEAEYFGLSVPRIEEAGKWIAATCAQERKSADLVPGDRGALVVFPAPSVAETLVDSSPRQILDTLLPALERLAPGLRQNVARAHTIRFDEGATIFYPGYLRHLVRFPADAFGPRISLAGDYLVAPTVEGAVRSGLRAAERLLGR